MMGEWKLEDCEHTTHVAGTWEMRGQLPRCAFCEIDDLRAKLAAAERERDELRSAARDVVEHRYGPLRGAKTDLLAALLGGKGK